MRFFNWNNYSKLSFLNKSARFIFELLLKPKTLSEDSKRREFILNIIFFGSIILLLLLDASVLYHSVSQGNNYPGVPFIAFSIVPLTFIGLLVLSRIGKPAMAAYLLVLAYLCAITYGAVNWGVDLQPVILSYALIIVISSILISTRAAFIVTMVICAIIIPLWYSQINHIIPVQWYWKDKPQSTDVLVFASILFLIMTVSWLSNREIERSLKRARASEAALLAQRDRLEIMVEERTRELQKTQSEKISQLYRFAEFGRLSSGLFHDLMNPLTSISLYLDKLNQTNPEAFKETKGYLSKAFEASKRIDLFTTAVRKQLQHRESDEQFSLNDGIEHGMQLLAHKAWQNKAQVVFQADEQVTAYANPLKFHQIIVNLISNAIDSYDEPDLTNDRNRTVQINLNRTADSVIIEVTDTGTGISPEHLKKIFDPFFTTKTTDKGTGIGLATTKQIVERDLRGQIEIDTKVGIGTTFRIIIPLASLAEHQKINDAA